MKKIIYILAVVLGFSNLLSAQDQEVMSKNYLFEDGIYLSFEDFKNNQPVYKWEEVKANVIQNPLTFNAKSDKIFYVPSEDRKLENLWGFSLDGIPYVNLNLETSVLEQYAGMRVRGKICYYTYEQEQPKTASITAYNPYTRKPFRSSELEVTEKVHHEMMLRMEDGKVDLFTLDNFKNWIQDEDIQLTASLSDLKAEEVEEKLFKCLLIYNDRNEVLVNKTPTKN